MGVIFGFLKRLIKFVVYGGLYLGVLAAVIILIPNLPPYTKFSSIQLEPTLARVGPLAPNDLLNNPEKLYKDKLLGPEAFQMHNGEVYTSLATGEIVKLSTQGHVTFVTKIGEPCTGLSQEHKCGRPLGFQIDEKNRQLYVADTYHGIWKVDLKTDKKQLLVSPRAEIEGTKPRLFNNLALSKNGDFYWTDSSSDFQLKDGTFTLLSDPSGRLFHYNAAKNQSKVLLEKLWLPNGLAMSPDGQFLVVAESATLKLLKYHINGPKKGQSEVFVAGLPGIPDNVRALPDGSGVLVGLYTVFDDANPLVTKSLAPLPHVRKLFARAMRLLEIPFEFLNHHYPSVVFEEVVYNIGHFKGMSAFSPGMSGLLQVDWSGNIVASYYNMDGSLGGISDAIALNDKLLLGCPHGQDFVAAVAIPPLLKKAFTAGKSTPPKSPEPVKEAPKPKEAKPQQATPKAKVEEKKEAPKVAKPVLEPPKPTQPPKPVETVKVTTPKPAETVKVTTPKPAEKKPAPPKPIEPVKAATPKPVETKPKVEPKAAPAKPATQPPKPAQDAKTTPPKQAASKPAAPKVETKPKPAPKPTETKQKTDKPVPEQIPIVEDIPSDTAKPKKEKLKVIKRDGPTEIPNPVV